MKKYLNELLEKAKITSVQRQENASIIDDIKKLLGSQFDAPVYFRRGGSLAKKTANIYDADIDLLCYLDDSTNMTLEQIYEETYLVLSKTYIVNKKNSAIEILGKQDDYSWDYRIDIVPGKYVNYESSYDVFLWCNKDKKKLKTNPDKQISKITEYEHRDVIRIIKILRHLLNFKFRSFLLELFIVDYVTFCEDDDIVDKLHKVCSDIEKLGEIRLYDPANSNNDLTELHNDYEIKMIKYHLTRVLVALKTDNSKALSDLINTQMQLDTEKYYYDYAVQKSQIFKNIIERPTEYSDIRIKARRFIKNYKTYVDYSDIEVIEKDTKLEFKVSFPGYIEVKKIEWLIVNTGYEARKSNQLRGNLFESSEIEDEIPINLRKRKTEHTSYSGVHYVISKVTDKSNNQYYSTPFKVRVS